MDQLPSYVRIWSMTTGLRIYSSLAPGSLNADMRSPNGINPVYGVLAALALAFCLPRRAMIVATALTIRVCSNLAKGGALGNSQTWATHTDLPLLAALLAAGASHGWLRPLDASAQKRVIAAAAPTVRTQFVIFYSASAFWKINSSFASPTYSCGSMFFVQLLEWLPDEYAEPLARPFALVGPWGALVVEHLIPALQALLPACGVLLTVAFHWLIGMTPCPNNVSSFGATCVPRLFFLLPEETAVAMSEPFTWAVATVVAAAATAATRPLQSAAVSCVQGSGLDINLIWLSLLVVLFARAAWLRLRRRSPDDDSLALPPPFGRLSRWTQHAIVGAAVLYSYVNVLLGLQERGGCVMFSQIRFHGGTNHLLGVPTGVLQRVFAHTSPEVNALGGGVLRVEATNLSWVENAFAEHYSSRSLRLLRGGGVLSEFIVPGTSPTLDLHRPDSPIRPRFYPHTLSALGLKALLRHARHRGQPFRLTFTPLPGTHGDEAWRRGSGARTVSIVDDGQGRAWHCIAALAGGDGGTVPVGNEPCTATERELASPAEPVWNHWSRVITWNLAPMPNPIIEPLVDEMHCVSVA